jgi:uncharacterized protein YegP (UPF0339 family)
VRYDVWKANDGWRWRLVARNGRIVCESGEAYIRKSSADRALTRVLRFFTWKSNR